MEIVEVVRRWQAGESQRGMARGTGLARETVSKYLAAPGTLGLLPNGPPPNEEQRSGVFESPWCISSIRMARSQCPLCCSGIGRLTFNVSRTLPSRTMPISQSRRVMALSRKAITASLNG